MNRRTIVKFSSSINQPRTKRGQNTDNKKGWVPLDSCDLSSSYPCFVRVSSVANEFLGVLKLVLSGVALLAWTTAATAQFTSGSSGSSGMGSSGSSGSAGSITTGINAPGFGTAGFGTTGSTGTGTGFTGGTTGRVGSSSYGGSSGSGTYPVSTTNPFASTYANPLSAGLPTNSGTSSSGPAFGSPLYGKTTVPNLQSTGSTGGLSSSTSMTNMVGGSSVGVKRSLPYQAVYGPVAWPAAPATSSTAPLKARADLQEMLGQSASLPSRAAIKVMTNGSAVVLQGKVADHHERQLAEAIVRLSPGVYDVHNELTVSVAP